MNLSTQIEALLFVSGEALSYKKLTTLLDVSLEDIKIAISQLRERYQTCESALQVVEHAHAVELVSRPEYASLVQVLVKDQTQGELTKPSLEALTIIAYRGPLTRPELEQIRGVQSALILRNLMLRGLVEMTEEVRLGMPVYRVTGEFLKFIGIERVEDLPEYEQMHHHPNVVQVLDELQVKQDIVQPASVNQTENT